MKAFAYQQVQKQIKFNYANIDDERFLRDLRYVKTSAFGHITYQVRFPNAPIDHEDSLLLRLHEGKLDVRTCRETLAADEDSEPSKLIEKASVTDLIKNFPLMGVYDKFVCSCFLACAREFV